MLVIYRDSELVTVAPQTAEPWACRVKVGQVEQVGSGVSVIVWQEARARADEPDVDGFVAGADQLGSIGTATLVATIKAFTVHTNPRTKGPDAFASGRSVLHIGAR